MRALKSRSADLAALAALTLSVTAAFAGILFRNQTLYIRDVTRFFYPNFAVLRDAIRSGSLPFWTSRFNAGQPFAANPAYAALYPPQWAAALFDGTLGFRLEIVAHYLLAAIGTYVLLRSMRVRPAAALFGAFSFALGGMLLSLSNLINVLFGVAWLPWLAFAVRRFLLGRAARDFALAALILGSILILGDQAVILQAGFLCAACAIRYRGARGLLLCAALVAVALAVGGAQIIPALDHQRDSGRATPVPFATATQWSLPAVRVLELALPSLFGSFREWTFYWAGMRFYGNAGVPWVFSFYQGLLVFVLALAGLLRRVRGWPFTLIVSAISYAFAVFPLLYLAGVHSIRYPEKFFIVGVLALTVFAAVVADQIADDESLRRTATVIAFCVTLAAVAWFIWLTPAHFAAMWRLSGYFGDLFAQARSAAAITIGTGAVLFLILGARRFLSPPLWMAMLALFVLADLAPRIGGLTPAIDGSYFDPPPVAPALRDARVYNDADWRLALLPTPRIPVEQRAWRVRNAMLPEAQAIWGIGAVLENDITRTNLIPSIDFSRMFWAAQIGQRAELVQLFLAMAGTTDVAELRDATSAGDPIRIIHLGNPRFYFADRILRGPIVPASSRAAFTDLTFTPAAGRVLRAAERPNAIDLDVDATGDALLVLSVTRHKYWRATIDSAPAPLHPTNIAFQSLVVPRGRHHVALRYGNPLVVTFGIVSIVSAAVLLAIAVGGALRSRAPRPQWPH